MKAKICILFLFVAYLQFGNGLQCLTCADSYCNYNVLAECNQYLANSTWDIINRLTPIGIPYNVTAGFKCVNLDFDQFSDGQRKNYKFCAYEGFNICNIPLYSNRYRSVSCTYCNGDACNGRIGNNQTQPGSFQPPKNIHHTKTYSTNETEDWNVERK